MSRRNAVGWPILNLDLFVTPEYDYAIWSPSSSRTAEKALFTPALRSMEPPAARSSVTNLPGCVQRRAFMMGPIASFLFFLPACARKWSQLAIRLKLAAPGAPASPK